MDNLTLSLFIFYTVIREGPKWETPEYVRDGIAQGNGKTLIILGHAESEVPGMKELATSLTEMFPVTSIHFIANERLFNII